MIVRDEKQTLKTKQPDAGILKMLKKTCQQILRAVKWKPFESNKHF